MSRCRVGLKAKRRPFHTEIEGEEPFNRLSTAVLGFLVFSFFFFFFHRKPFWILTKLAVCYIWTEKKTSVSLTAANAERKACFPFVEFLFFIYLLIPPPPNYPSVSGLRGRSLLAGRRLNTSEAAQPKCPRPLSLLPARLLLLSKSFQN